jgi:hypothetical protein
MGPCECGLIASPTQLFREGKCTAAFAVAACPEHLKSRIRVTEVLKIKEKDNENIDGANVA